jgi:hypothetical protein
MPYDPVNLGAHTLRKTIMQFLSDRMPKYLELIRAEYPELDEAHLPPIAYFDAYDPYTAVDYPAIGAYINGSDEPQWDDINFTGGQTFTSAYDVTLFVACRTALLGTDDAGVTMWEQPERDSAMRIRDIYLGAMKAVIFNEPTFGTASIEIGHTRLVRKTYKEMMGEPWQSGPVYVASGLISANIEHTESTSPQIYGYVNNVDTAISLVDD